jgi:hypothetical protein
MICVILFHFSELASHLPLKFKITRNTWQPAENQLDGTKTGTTHAKIVLIRHGESVANGMLQDMFSHLGPIEISSLY